MARRESSKYSGTCDTGFVSEAPDHAFWGLKSQFPLKFDAGIYSIKTISCEFRNANLCHQGGKSHLMRKFMAKISAYGVN